MGYEKKAYDVLNKFEETILYEEGRLAFINRYGAILSDDEKLQAKQLITAQSNNLDRLLSLYKEVNTLIGDIYKTGDAMSSIIDKLMSVNNQNVEMTISNSAINDEKMNSDNSNIASSEGTMAKVEEPVAMSENSFVSSNDNSENNTMINPTIVFGGTESVAGGMEDGSQFNTGENAGINVDVPSTNNYIDNNGVDANLSGITEKSEVTSDNNLGVNPLGEKIDDGVTTGFVLSPIDEGVSPVVVNEEVNKVEQADVVGQSSANVDLIKNDIVAKTVADEQNVEKKVEQYSRMSNADVKAILVTNEQYNSLSASRNSQKALLVSMNGNFSKTNEPNTVLPLITDDMGQKEEVAPSNENSSGNPVVNNDIQNNSNALQSLIDKANALYNAGNVVEAQQIFEMIGTMNKEGQENVPVNETTDSSSAFIKR